MITTTPKLAMPPVARPPSLMPHVENLTVLITGSRAWTDELIMIEAIQTEQRNADHLSIIHGGCPEGADFLAEKIATALGIPTGIYLADWTAPCMPDWCQPDHRRYSQRYQGEYCPQAGLRRNQQMVDASPDLVLAFVRNQSRGATDCVRRARRANIRTKLWSLSCTWFVPDPPERPTQDVELPL